MMKDGEWFELKSERKPRMHTASWIPLYREIHIRESRWPEIGYAEDVIVTRSAIFPDSVASLHEQLEWSDLYLARGNRPEANHEMYSPARVLWNHHVQQNDEFEDGEFLVFEHHTSEGREILISPDLICALKLERFGDNWLYPIDGYSEVIRQTRTEDGTVNMLEIRAKHLKDYLCARKSQLAAGTFRQRRAILASKPSFRFSDHRDKSTWYEFGVCEINEHGGSYGQPVGISIYGYADTDQNDDVPVYDISDERETWSNRREIKHEGPRLYLVGAEMVLMEIVPRAERSPIVREDEVVPAVHFIVDNNDSRLTAVDLVRPPNRWLWFSPRLVPSILSVHKTGLRWLTADTGMLDIPPHPGVHFGMNACDLINIFAKDIGELPLWWQERFVSYNVPPDGGVSSELIAAQMECRPASTTAPESRLLTAAEMLDQSVQDAFGQRLFKKHASELRLWRDIHRFAAPDEPAFYALAKDINRAVVERMDIEFLRGQTKHMDSRTGSIKRLAEMINQRGGNGFAATTVLVGLNELRQRDSHLPSANKLDEAYQMAGVDRAEPTIRRGKALIAQSADCLGRIAVVLAK